MSGGAMELVKLVCVAKAHANGPSDSPLTDGLPITAAMRFPRRAAAPAKAGQR